MNNIKNLRKIFASLLALLFFVQFANAGELTNTAESSGHGFVFWFTIIVSIFLIKVLIYLLYTLQSFLNIANGKESESVFTTINKKMTGAVPHEQEDAIRFHHVYDGIYELDNSLPPWWLYMFYGTIIFAFVYMGYYHIWKKGELQIAEYNSEMKLADAGKAEFLKTAEASIDENNIMLVSDKAKIENGKTIFLQYCSACHGQSAEGGVGPNLTDEYWLHGGSIKDVFKTVKYGVPQKGMISWEKQLKPADIQEVSSYILSLKGSKPANGKAAQGDLYQEK